MGRGRPLEYRRKKLPKKAEKYFKYLLTGMLGDLSESRETHLELDNEVGVLSDPVDRAIEERQTEMRLRILERERGLLTKVKEALNRIESGTYGICDECGDEIGMARLKARPVTLLCIHCKKAQEARERLTGN
jgi:DnaK suppressor protein